MVHSFLRAPPSAGYIEEMDRRATTTTYLERSSQQPLTLVVRVLGNDYMTILLSYSDRWKRSDLDIKFPSTINDLVGHREKMPILESLAIVGRPYPPTQKYGTAFRTAPYLTELNLDVKDTEKRDVGKVDVSVNQAPHRPTQSRLR
ncbi:hypothetical protein F5887DRAFT_1078416 [Amanita rubescens]|nr:hypothetical protein F5887DRAFT_1078416 [Amanita rubescens]